MIRQSAFVEEFNMSNRKDSDRADDGTFRKGHKKRGGRKKGTPNAANKAMQDALIKAAATASGDGDPVEYFKHLALKHPKAYCRLLGKLL
jgi:hypothetical protein